MWKKLFFTLCFGFIYFITAFFTLSHYGISWDEPTHFKRGQGYLWYFLTGDNDYHKLPGYDLLRARTDPNYHERSIYQDDKHNAAFYRTIDGSHPPLSDIASSLTNMIFYQKLGWVGDVEGYHLFEIFVASLGVAVLFLLVYESFGTLAAFFSAIFFATYPLFWAESHFNIKDPVETSWIILTLYLLWKGLQAKAVSFILLSSIFAGFALGTKLNVVFLPFIVLPWFLGLFVKQKKELLGFVRSRNFILSIIFYPIISFSIFYISYPFLWENPIVNILKVATYYERNALDPAFANAILPDWPFYAVKWILLSSPPLVLLGIFFSMIHIKGLLFKRSGLFLLALLWFSVTVARVSIPGVNIYGGVRQIMEYIPAISILAGIGIARVLTNKRKVVVVSAFLATMIISIFPLVGLHPNENVYFNFLSGGLKGAIESGIPAAGNSFGNAYYQAVPWVNKYAVRGAKITLLQSSSVNIPGYKLRSDIDLSSDYFSGINRSGEYLMALTYNLEHKENFYAWEYADKFLAPIYEVKADDVPILKVWKNDLEHTKPSHKLFEQLYDKEIKIKKASGNIQLEVNDEVILSRATLYFIKTDNCDQPVSIFIETSTNGEHWIRKKDWIPFPQVGGKKNLENNSVSFFFAGSRAKYVRFILDSRSSCLLNNTFPQIYVLSP